MPLKVVGIDGNAFDQNSIEAGQGRTFRTLVQITPSGAYPTGGDALDFTNGGVASAVPPNARGIAQIALRPISKLTSSFTAAYGSYMVLNPNGVVPIPVSSVNALKLKLMLDIATEYTAGAYGADVLGDVISAEVTWLR